MSKVICHLCLHGPYNEDWNYQENILPKYHSMMGNTVYQIVTHYYWDNGIIKTLPEQRYINKYGVNIIRLKPDNQKLLRGNRWERYSKAFEELEKINPDFLFIHDVQFMDTDRVAKYLKQHKNCTAVADNHSDYSNSAKNWLSRNVLHRIIWRYHAWQLCRCVRKFYGVLPARVKFLTDVYHLPEDKCELLVMGADDEQVERAIANGSRDKVRRKYDVQDGDFLVLTGGKINRNRPETLSLMRAIRDIKDLRIKLLVFGTVSEEYKKDFEELCDNDRIMFAGWIESNTTYDYMAAADLIVFPGLHSVMWEQAVGMGVPCVFREIEGFYHVDLGGNAVFIDKVSAEDIKAAVERIASDNEKYSTMKKTAEEKGMAVFSYKNIAGRCVM